MRHTHGKMSSRIRQIAKSLKKSGLDAIVYSCPHNISYLTDSRSSDSYLLVTSRESFYLTDARYSERAKRTLREIEVITVKDSLSGTISEICKNSTIKRLGFEAKKLSFFGYQAWKKALKGVRLLPAASLAEDLRIVKSPEELNKINTAVSITIDALRYIEDFISPGQTELEVTAELERFIRLKGAYSSSFDIIVASGENSSYPHHITSSRKIRKNEPVLIDMGVDYKGYKSDLTRVVFLGKLRASVKEIYGIVKEAQSKVISAVKPGVLALELDKIARDYISQKGFGSLFTHSLGHGVGLEVHEAPTISTKNSLKLKPGMVFTVEPGIYLPGKFGIRLEDMVVVTEKGVRILSGSLNK